MMNNPILFTDDQFNPQNAGACHLLIHLETISYSYAIVDKKNGRLNVVAKKYFPENTSAYTAINQLEILIAENDFAGLDFEKVKISLQTKAFTFVPQQLYAQNDLPQYGRFLGAQPDSVLIDTDIHPFELKNIYAIDAEVENTLRKAFIDPLIVCQANPLIAGINNLKKNGNEGELFLNFNHDSFEAGVIKGDTLELYNIFEMSNSDEFNYFILKLIDELGINREHSVTISGDIDNQSEHYSRLQKYFDKIYFGEPGIKDMETFKGFKSHMFFSLLSLDLCE